MFGASAISDETVRAAATGSKLDAERLFAALKPQLCAMVTVRLSPSPSQFQAVEELAQQVLMALTDGLPRLQTHTCAALRSYASSVVTHKVADYLRRPEITRLSRMHSLDSTPYGPLQTGRPRESLAAGDASPSSHFRQSEELQIVLAELGRLRPNYRAVITQAFFDQLPLSEIADRMQITRSAASMLLLRAVRSIRRNLTGSSKVHEPCA